MLKSTICHEISHCQTKLGSSKCCTIFSIYYSLSVAEELCYDNNWNLQRINPSSLANSSRHSVKYRVYTEVNDFWPCVLFTSVHHAMSAYSPCWALLHLCRSLTWDVSSSLSAERPPLGLQSHIVPNSSKKNAKFTIHPNQPHSPLQAQ